MAIRFSHLGHIQLQTGQLPMKIQGHHIHSSRTSQFHSTDLSNLTHSLGSLFNVKNMNMIGTHMCPLSHTKSERKKFFKVLTIVTISDATNLVPK